ncbi:Crp/Fnr family transcriptional regulator [Flavobacterium sp. LS1P3]|uniref:Crp/Fnr family transcriptional regulator n=1 Tax=Flavobacterium sp. LS1P3 TaxID=3401720 RepID=UPI003AADB55A
MVNNQYILPNSHTQLAVYLNGVETISARATQAIAEIATVLKIKRNQDLQSIGHTCKTIYFINKGIARIYYYHNGVDITESFIFENNIIARVESLFTGKPSRKAIQVLEDSEIVAIDATQLFDLYDTYPETERLFRKIFEAGYVDTVNRMEAIQFHTAEERYTLLIKEQPTLLQRVPLKHIASYLGITQVTLSRIRAAIR